MSIPSATIIGGLSSRFARNAADFYPTPWECTQALLDTVYFPDPVWEPACGDGAISVVAAACGMDVVSTDLHFYGFGRGGVDFLKADVAPSRMACIITNPPFNLAEAFIRKARSFDVPFAMLLKATYWHAASREAMFRETSPEHVFAMNWRPHFAPERGASPTMDVIWTVWGERPAKTCNYSILKKPTERKGVFA